ncbi:glutathione S-transferase family protein [Bradyrhizobium sp. Pear77]|uniref:glutathione S-transferase family protein n=1 Tax=Bradyrhizobium altum TaxID=1571202 RepID=UPI001E64AF1E|nr:glutathione S-transferase family protein [Bradyrhizobium altum]MCC8953281.1 glutathione S-transferase family protein [Bradyrhizobium altum]
MLVEGKWVTGRPIGNDAKGSFVRPESAFRNWVNPDGSSGPTGRGEFKAASGRYHLYVSLACPWASRTLIARKLKKLDDVISVSVVEPKQTDQGWRFGDYPGANRDTINGATYLHEVYTRAAPGYTGRVSVPVLWDKELATIVNNESADILRILNSGFGVLADDSIDLYPQELRSEIDAWNDRIYPKLSNGVYRAGFASSQEAYDEASRGVFEMLDQLELHLARQKSLVGERLTEADVRLFVTLIRFDAAYHGVFKCNLRRIADYPALSAYLRRLLRIPGIRETVSIDHIKRSYYALKAVNPSGIVPVGPDLRALGVS